MERDDISVQHNALYLTASGEDIDTIAHLDTVRSVQESVPLSLFNEVARIVISIAETADLNIKTGKYEGGKQAVAVADTGLDLGSLSDMHPAFKGRVTALHPLGRKAQGLSNDPVGHGTHVAGSVLGNDVSSTMGGKEGKGGRIRGTAPKAKLLMQSILADNEHLMPDSVLNIWDILKDANEAESKPRISTNSWGASYPHNDLIELFKALIGQGIKQHPYDDNAGTLDRFVWHHPDRKFYLANSHVAT